MPPALQPAFRALADPTRREILVMLGRSDMTIGEVSARFQMTRAAVKKHLTVLEEGDLISVRSAGRERINSLNPNALRPVTTWLSYFDQFWDDKLANLKETIEGDPT
ncbi:metalloregulator ArsR/SmtB family transcription factor [Thalassococcus sp. S3]|uniref:metalloregulator ArsR/SmtB family transcription factor n=1 Tax=Thalassococcus sp. S3 TaxID=2017482 RepID=UPI00102414FA|nr:metalloregulator ArsR/SmtB family transcription factor [Thalassococcus sp. S3]QBF32451.1 transcriptional regulator [Thalassococcus sp. S3]